MTEVPDGCPYAVLHSQDIGDLKTHGSCHIAFVMTTKEGDHAPYWQRVLTDEAPVAALEDQGLTVD